MISALKKELELAFKDIQVVIPEDSRETIIAPEDAVLTILRFLKDKGYDHLALISCADWIEEKAFELIYIIGSYGAPEHKSVRTQVILKTRISRENPQFITIIPVFENAEFYEREIHELFGINFEGHPRLTPLFLEREYKIPPFRKDFDTRKYVEDVFDKIPAVEEEKR
jgi:NADH-quinone oxidoreductase subunit C